MDLGEAERLARRLMDQHGLTGWRLVLDRARTRAGVCRPARREIGLSRVLTALHTEAEVTDTVLHEVAHALVGAAHGHDEVWRATALQIGCTGARCVPAEAARPQAPWVGTCPRGHTTDRHRRPARPASCSRCSRRFDLAALLEWRLHGQPAAMSPQYLAELALLSSRAPGRGWQPEQPGPVGVPAPRAAEALGVGTRVRIGGRGRFAGAVGRIEKRGRTRYHVRTSAGLVAAPFALVDRA